MPNRKKSAHTPEEPHPPNPRNLNRTDLGPYDTESTASVQCALVFIFFLLFVRSCAIKRLRPSTKY